MWKITKDLSLTEIFIMALMNVLYEEFYGRQHP